MAKYLDPKNDVVFKKIFGGHPHLLISFLNALLKFEDGSIIVSLEYLKDELVPDSPLKKRSIVDVRCKDNNGRQFIVEMQMELVEAFMERMLYNTAKIYSNQIKKCDKYIELQPVYGLAILDDDFDKKTDKYYHSFVMQNPQNPEEKISGMNLVFIELPKFIPQNKDEKELAVLWLRFLREVKEETRVIAPELIANPEINEAIKMCEEAAYTEEEKAAYDKYWDTVSYEKTLIHGKLSEGRAEGLQEGIEKGLQEGIAKGIEKGRAEGAKEKEVAIVLNIAQTGLDIEQIVKLTKLPIETVKEILTQK
ncbi:MAG: Rpn family recombination-promoting nuclease/putative transposase [Prevotellaceae bacterium]|nr:Rpn family recombination-promoting nuclease/putative transposase [Prevotellaceae bacterium]